MYFVVYATTITSQAPFPDPEKDQYEKNTKVSTTQFVLVSTGKPKPMKYVRGDIVSANIICTDV